MKVFSIKFKFCSSFFQFYNMHISKQHPTMSAFYTGINIILLICANASGAECCILCGDIKLLKSRYSFRTDIFCVIRPD